MATSGTVQRAATPAGPALVMVLTTVVATLLTAEVWREVASGTGVAGWDAPVHAWLVAHRRAPVTVVMQALTAMSSTPGIVLGAGALAVVLVRRLRSWWALPAVAATSGSASVLTSSLKVLTDRNRPPLSDLVGGPSASASFPSGHTVSGTVLLGMVAVAVMVLVRRSAWWRAPAIAACAVLVAGVGVSRVYLGYHWMTDVLAGWLVAAGVLAVAALVARLDRRRFRSTAPDPSRSGGSQHPRANLVPRRAPGPRPTRGTQDAAHEGAEDHLGSDVLAGLARVPGDRRLGPRRPDPGGRAARRRARRVAPDPPRRP